MLALNVMSGYNLLNECVKYLKSERLSPVSAGVELLKMMKISAALTRPDHGPHCDGGNLGRWMDQTSHAENDLIIRPRSIESKSDYIASHSSKPSYPS